jgi:hypothetical protein
MQAPPAPPPPPFKPRSNAALYVAIVAFLFFALCGPGLYVGLARPWESPPAPPDAGPPDAGPPDTGPPVIPVITYRGTVERSSSGPFGGQGRYCRYAATYGPIELELTTQGTDDQGRPIITGGRGTATYNERVVDRCPHPPLASNPQQLAFVSAQYEEATAVVSLRTQSGAPTTENTLRGTFADGAFAGTLVMRRNDQQDALLLFQVEAPFHLVTVAE